MKAVYTTGAPAAIGPYSQGMIVNNLFYSSGQIPLRADGTLVNGDIKIQTKQVLNNITAILEEAGASLNSVIKTTVFLTDMTDFAEMNEVYASYFTTHKPARSCVEVSRLPKDVRVEIEVIALV